MSRLPAAALTAAAVVWAVLIVLAPALLRRGVVAGPVSLVYAASSRICHQRPERSFVFAGFQMPVCARCSGLYLSGAAGALLAWSRPRRRPRLERALLFAAAIPTAMTFALEFSGLMRFSNVTRAVAALPLGACAGWLFVGMLRYDSRLDGHKNADR